MFTNDFLTRAELQDLTGYRKFTSQARWLEDRQVNYYVAKTGEPKVPRAEVMGALLRKHTKIKPSAPNFEAITG